MRYGAVIVANGSSARMEQFRQMKLGDMSIAERVIVNFRRAGITDIVMVTGSDAAQIEKELREFGVQCIGNENFENPEMFDLARLGLEYLRGRCDRIFFTPVDVPFFTDTTVSEEMKLMESDSSIRVVVPVCNGRGGHPLLIHEEAIPALLAYKGDRGMRGACDSLPEDCIARVIVDDEGAVARTGNTDDYRKLVDIHNDRILHPQVKLTFASTSKFFGPGIVSLLKEIDRCGNVREACERCGFSYSKGWKIIRNCEEKFGYNIVDRQQGGQTGGSASVTDKGRDLLAVYDVLEAELEEVAENRFRDLMKEYHLTHEE